MGSFDYVTGVRSIKERNQNDKRLYSVRIDEVEQDDIISETIKR